MREGCGAVWRGESPMPLSGIRKELSATCCHLLVGLKADTTKVRQQLIVDANTRFGHQPKHQPKGPQPKGPGSVFSQDSIEATTILTQGATPADGSPALGNKSSRTCRPCYPGSRRVPLPLFQHPPNGLPLLTTGSASPLRLRGYS